MYTYLMLNPTLWARYVFLSSRFSKNPFQTLQTECVATRKDLWISEYFQANSAGQIFKLFPRGQSMSKGKLTHPKKVVAVVDAVQTVQIGIGRVLLKLTTLLEVRLM